MGGVGSGRHRNKPGRPPKSQYERDLGGNAAKRGRVLTHPSSPEPPPPVIEEFDAPNELTIDERHVWMELAPHAFQKGTLNPASSCAFIVLVRCVLRERQYAQSVNEKDSGKHASVLKQVVSGLDAYGLRPNGKPMPDRSIARPANKADAFRKSKANA